MIKFSNTNILILCVCSAWRFLMTEEQISLDELRKIIFKQNDSIHSKAVFSYKQINNLSKNKFISSNLLKIEKAGNILNNKISNNSHKDNKSVNYDSSLDLIKNKYNSSLNIIKNNTSLHISDNNKLLDFCYSYVLRSTLHNPQCYKTGFPKPDKILPILITATPRSGTVFTKKCLRSKGIFEDDWTNLKENSVGFVSWIHLFSTFDNIQIQTLSNNGLQSKNKFPYFGPVQLKNLRFKNMLHQTREVLVHLTSLSCGGKGIKPQLAS